VQIGIYNLDVSSTSAKTIKKNLDDGGIQSIIFSQKLKLKAADCIIVIGGDRGVRNYFHANSNSTIPVLGIVEAEASGFLAQIELKEFPTYLNRLKKQDYTIEDVPRLGIKIDGKGVYPVLNDAAVFPSKSAMLMEHTLRVNGEEVWHDSSDGIIIATPIGSSAYSMSAGGPVIFQESAVFGIISVNSLDVTRRPLIVSNDSSIEDRYKVKKNCTVYQVFACKYY